jgi:hypothetical protein
MMRFTSLRSVGWLAVLLLAACTSPPPPAPTVGAGAAVGELDIRKVAEAMAAAKSFRLVSHGTDEQGNPIDVVMEVLRPDRQHTTMSVAGQSLESITIGSDLWTNRAGTWTKVSTSAPMSPMAQFVNADEIVSSFDEGVQRGDKITLGGREMTDGVLCQAIVITPADPNDEASTLWVGVADNLPRRLELAQTHATLTFNDWNAALRIEPPG